MQPNSIESEYWSMRPCQGDMTAASTAVEAALGRAAGTASMAARWEERIVVLGRSAWSSGLKRRREVVRGCD